MSHRYGESPSRMGCSARHNEPSWQGLPDRHSYEPYKPLLRKELPEIRMGIQGLIGKYGYSLQPEVLLAYLHENDVAIKVAGVVSLVDLNVDECKGFEKVIEAGYVPTIPLVEE